MHMNISKHRSLVTGAAGFIGSELLRQLLDEGQEVLVYDNFSFGRRSHLLKSKNLKVVKGELNDERHLKAAFASWRPSVVFHMAALHFIPYCNAHSQETLRVNVEGTENVLIASRIDSVECFVFASTAAVYGISSRPHRETEAPAPVDIYGLSKLFGEFLVRKFHKDTGIRCRIARLFNGYGRRETSPHVIPEIVKQIRLGDTIKLGNTKPKRDFIHTSDISRALRTMANGGDFGIETFNVGSGVSVSVRAFVNVIGSILNRPLEIKTDPKRIRKVERLNLVADRNKLKKLLGWEPKVDFRQGVVDILQEAGLVAESR